MFMLILNERFSTNIQPIDQQKKLFSFWPTYAHRKEVILFAVFHVKIKNNQCPLVHNYNQIRYHSGKKLSGCH